LEDELMQGRIAKTKNNIKRQKEGKGKKISEIMYKEGKGGEKFSSYILR